MFSKSGNKAGIAYSLVSLGDLELKLKKHEKALEYFDRAFKVREEMGDILEQHRILLRKADVSYKRKRYDHSLEQYKNVKIDLEKPDLKYRDTSAIKYHYAVALSGIADNYYMLKEYRRALKFNRDALDLNFKIRASANIIKNYNSMGKIYTKLSDYVRAFEYINKGLKLAISYKLKEQELNCLKSLVELHKTKSEFQMAFIQYEKITEIKESLFNEKKNEQIEMLRAEYGFQNKENEIVLLKNKTKLKNLEKNSLIAVLVMSFILLIVISIRFYHKSKTNKVLNQQKIKLENAYADLQEINKWAVELERKNMAMAVTTNHEIIQPLTVLQGNFELLTNKLNLDSFSDKEKSYILKINKSITRITSILSKYKDVDDFTIEKYDQNKNMIVYKEDFLKENQ